MENVVVTLLDMSDALISENKLNCFKKYGMNAGYTDMFSITGGNASLEESVRIPDEFGLKNRTAPYVFNALLKDNTIFAVNEAGNKSKINENDNTCGIRPCILCGNLYDELVKNSNKGYNGVKEVEVGEYPQYAAAHMVGLALEDEYSNHTDENGYNGCVLMLTGKEYTFVKDGKFVSYPEYYYGSNKYIRVCVSCDDKGVILSNGNTVYNGEYVWIKVSPVKWFVDAKSKRLISKFVLLSGINPDINMLDFVSKYMKDDMFVDSLTMKQMYEMISKRFCTLNIEDQMSWLDRISKEFDRLDKLSYEDLKKVLEFTSQYEYGYSRKLTQYYF